MKLLLCLCLIFCFKTVFSQISCFSCGLRTSNIENPYKSLHNALLQQHLSETSQLIQKHMFSAQRPNNYEDAERPTLTISYRPRNVESNFYPQSFGNNFRQQSSSYMVNRPSIDINPYPKRLVISQQHTASIFPRSSFYGDDEQSNPMVHIESRPYERSVDKLDLLTELFKQKLRQQSSSDNQDLPSIDNYPRASVSARQNTESIFPRSSVYEDEEQSNSMVHIEPKPYGRFVDKLDLLTELFKQKLRQQSSSDNQDLPSIDNYPRASVSSRQDTESIFPRPSVYEDEQRSKPNNRFGLNPYERSAGESDLYSQFLRHSMGLHSSNGNENIPSSESMFPRSPIYEDEKRSNYEPPFNLPSRESMFPRPPVYVEEERFNPGPPRHRYYDEMPPVPIRKDSSPYADNVNAEEKRNNQPENHPSSSSKQETPKTTENPISNLPKQNDNWVRIMRPLQNNEMPITDIRKHNNFKLLPSDEECGKLEITNRIFAGEDTELGEFPWLALLEYRGHGRNMGFKCGGALINNRYVLTAAHCVIGKSLKPGQYVFRVRLGEHDVSKEIDCNEVDDCSDPPLDLKIEEIMVHGAYNTTDTYIYNDIALIRLKENIAFTDFVAPLCLPLNGERTNPGNYMTIAGWGAINNDTNSNIKQKAEVMCRDEKDCKELWKGFMNVENQLCAGGLSEKNTCTGDSGSPIISTSPKRKWYMEGITSFGSSFCGGAPVPNVYTRVSSYLTWILDNIRA